MVLSSNPRTLSPVSSRADRKIIVRSAVRGSRVRLESAVDLETPDGRIAAADANRPLRTVSGLRMRWSSAARRRHRELLEYRIVAASPRVRV